MWQVCVPCVCTGAHPSVITPVPLTAKLGSFLWMKTLFHKGQKIPSSKRNLLGKAQIITHEDLGLEGTSGLSCPIFYFS